MLYRILYFIREFREEFNKFYIILYNSLWLYFVHIFLLYFNKHYQVQNIFSRKSIKNIYICIYRSSYFSLFLNFHQSFRCCAVDWSRDSDGCYCVWTAPAWLIDWSVNGNDSTEFYAVSRTKKTVGSASDSQREQCIYWSVTYEEWRIEEIRRIENFFQLFNYYKSRKKKFDSVRAIKYLYSCQKSILQVLNTYFLNINFYPQFPNIFFSRTQSVR